jgi:hypothetical protein
MSPYARSVTSGISSSTGAYQSFDRIRRKSKLRPRSALTPAAPLSRQLSIAAAVTGQTKPSALTGIPGISCSPVVPSSANGTESAKTRRKNRAGAFILV